MLLRMVMMCMADEHGWVGVVGPFPVRRSSPSSTNSSLDSAASCSSMALTTLFGRTRCRLCHRLSIVLR